MTMSHLEGALRWWDAGCSVVTVPANGQKRPMGSWAEYQEFRAQRRKVEQWFRTTPEQGVGLICGEVSGGLEMTEIEAVRCTGEWMLQVDDQMAAHGVYDLWNGLTSSDHGYCESTPSGGIHILYRIIDEKVPGNTKIAMSENGKITYAETRGEGGFVVVAPSSGRVHNSGDAWSVLAGEVGTIPNITWDERCKIHAALKEALDERVLPTYERPAGVGTYDRSLGDRPGDAFEKDPSITIHDILLRNGWRYLGKSRGQDRYVHPHSSDMTTHSAVTGWQGSPNLYAWSGLPAQDYYTKFGLLAHLEFNGDFSAAGKHLRTLGYGTAGDAIDISDWDVTPSVPAAGLGDTVEPPTPGVAESSTETPRKAMIEQFSEKGVGRYAGQVLRDRVRYVSQEKAWRVYGAGIWGRDHEQHVPRMVARVSDVVDQKVEEIYVKAKEASDSGQADGKDMLEQAKKLKTFAKGIATNRGMKAVTEIMASTPGVGVSADSFDAALKYLALANGTFDLEAMELIPHSADHMLTKSVPLAYNPDAVATRWIKYMEEVIPDPAYRDYLQRAVGMALLGDTSESAFFVLWGETGCGKSQFLEVIKAVFGDYGVTAAASAFRESRNGDDSRKSNSLHALRGARYVATSETSERSALSGELVKRVTGGDTVTTHALYESEISWKPVFTMFMGTNFRPVLDASDGAIWRRVKPINFPNTFFKDNQPTEAREKGLAERIIETELAGVFNWVLDGVRSYRAIGLKDPDGMHAAIQEYREDSDPTLGFINESLAEGTLVPGDDARMTTTDLYRMFVAWSQDNGVRFPIGKNKFSARLDALGYESTRGSGGVRMRKGLKRNENVWMVESQRPTWS